MGSQALLPQAEMHPCYTLGLFLFWTNFAGELMKIKT